MHDVFRAVGSAATTRNVIPLHVGEPAFRPPRSVGPAIDASFSAGLATYCDAAGLPALRGALAERVTRDTGRSVSAPQVVVTPGSTQALYALLTLLGLPGAEVLLPVPYWPVYVQQCAALGLRPRFYEVGEDGRIDLESLGRKLGSSTAAVVVNSPANPSGAILSRDTLSGLLAVTRDSGTPIVSDEAYEDFVFEGEHESIASAGAAQDGSPARVWTVRTFSKAFALTGLRVGYVVAPTAADADKLVRVQEASLVCPSTPAQHGALAALAERRSAVQVARGHLHGVRSRVLPLLRHAGLLKRPPPGGWYAMCRIPEWVEGPQAFADLLLHEYGVGVASGEFFVADALEDLADRAGAVRWVRVALCGDAESAEVGVRRLCAAARRS